MSNRASRRREARQNRPTALQMVMAAREHIAQVDGGRVQVLAEVEALARERREVEEDLRHAITAARVARQSWAAIGGALGVTGEAARSRYGLPRVTIHRARSVGGQPARTRRSAGEGPDAS